MLPEYFTQHDTSFYYDIVQRHNIKIFHDSIQKGGEIKDVKYTLNNRTHTFRLSVDESKEFYEILVLTENNYECVSVYIYKGTKVAELHNMSYNRGCAREGLSSPGGGKILLEFMVNHLKQNKDKYNINRIVLKDNSFIEHPSCPEKLFLARFKMIMENTTWYIKHGFKLYDAESNKPSKLMSEVLNHNKKIIDNLKIKDVEVISILKIMQKEEKNYSINVEKIKLLCDKNPLFKDLIEALSMDMKTYYCLIAYLLKQVFAPINKYNLFDFFGKSYYYDL